ITQADTVVLDLAAEARPVAVQGDRIPIPVLKTLALFPRLHRHRVVDDDELMVREAELVEHMRPVRQWAFAADVLELAVTGGLVELHARTTVMAWLFRSSFFQLLPVPAHLLAAQVQLRVAFRGILRCYPG